MTPLLGRGRRSSGPPDDALVVQGGLGRSDLLWRRAARNAERLIGVLGLSALAGRCAAEELARGLRHEHYRVATAGRLRAAGFPVVWSGARPHVTVVLPDLSDPTLSRYRATFGSPRRRPASDQNRPTPRTAEPALRG